MLLCGGAGEKLASSMEKPGSGWAKLPRCPPNPFQPASCPPPPSAPATPLGKNALVARPGADIGLTTDRKQFKPFLAQTLTCSLKFSEVLLCCERKKFTYFNMDVFKIECNGDFKVSKKKKNSCLFFVSAIFVAIFFYYYFL